MAIVINQGKHDTTQDGRFEPIVENGVLMQVKKITLSERLQNSIDITFQILNGKHKNRYIFDTVTFDADSVWAWKYRSLRKSAGVPYSKDESVKIDIEALLMNKAVYADLSVRKSKKPDDDREFQNVTYKVQSNTKAAVSTTKKADVSTTKKADDEKAVDLEDLEGMDDFEEEEVTEVEETEEVEDLNEISGELEGLEEEEPKPEPKKKKVTNLSTKAKAKKKAAPKKVVEEELKTDELPENFDEDDAVTIEDDDDDWD